MTSQLESPEKQGLPIQNKSLFDSKKPAAPVGTGAAGFSSRWSSIETRVLKASASSLKEEPCASPRGPLPETGRYRRVVPEKDRKV